MSLKGSSSQLIVAIELSRQLFAMGPLAVAGSHPGRTPGLNFRSSAFRSGTSSQGVAFAPLSCYHTLLSRSSFKLHSPERRRSSNHSLSGICAAQRVAEKAEQATSEAEVQHLYRSPFLEKNATEALLKLVSQSRRKNSPSDLFLMS